MESSKGAKKFNKNKIKPKEDNFCVQKPSGLGGSEGEGLYSGSEDCLYLDIKAPQASLNKSMPVMFWIHGGGNTSGLKDIYDFSKMVKRHDVIVVSINYRLGPFGWFTHPAIQDLQDGIDKTSNFGTLDIIAALKWVELNISKFGGDPNNVTIFGESAGGHNVFSLLVSKEANGLFHKAIAQSGYTTSISPQNAYKPKMKSSTSSNASWNVVNKILEEKGLKINQDEIDSNELREILLGLNSKDFFEVYANRPSYEEIPLLTADNIVIPLVGLRKALSMSELVNSVPTIAGSNRDEGKVMACVCRIFCRLRLFSHWVNS
jgi:para-nitrobenzyl esterase